MSGGRGAAKRRDLVALVADKDMEHALGGVLGRGPALGIRPLLADIFVHPQRDPGCRSDAAGFLRSFVHQYDFALTLFDHEGSGRESATREELESMVEQELGRAGWDDRAGTVVIEPELEAWLWTDSPELDRVAGWQGRAPGLRDWLRSSKFEVGELGKPLRPKEAFRDALRQVQKRPSPALFGQLAERASLERCVDPSFAKLKATLQRWFPA